MTPAERRPRLGMGLFILSEALFFLMLVLGWVWFHDRSGPEASRVLHPGTTAVFSALLFASSGTILGAASRARDEKATGLRVRLALTIALGLTFLVGQGFEYAALLGQGVNVAGGLFGTTFFTLTGFHGLHVLIGLLTLGTLLGLSLAGRLRGRHAGAVEAASMYWHFVDGVWVVIFSVVYLWGAL